MTRRKKLFPPIGVRPRERETTNSIQPTDERASCQCERVITPTKRREAEERGEIGQSISTAVACMWMWDCGERVGQLDVFIKMEQGVREKGRREHVKNRQWSASEHEQCSVSTLYMNAKQGVSCIRKRGCKSETFIARHFLSLTPHFSALGGKGMQEISRVTWNKLLRPGERQRGKGGRNAGRGREGKRARGYCELQIVLWLPSAKEQT